ncbi:DUF4402 domain-containing protein [Erythrobacter sp.]|uniref:DUF4402 domain-containing protein n=1 Tax=Erythrobacter sp. TaxID=1042 RepID=UPI001425D770|nr:DUF4402 domain-containing protein [Erythrobacter sp.]QIQ87013.1 MAG: DUF4402 domain-containing protein [Erythrobacter sp.]
MLARFSLLIAALCGLALPATAPPVLAQGACPQCDLPPGCRGKGNQNGNGRGNRNRNCQRLSIEIDSDIDFGRVVIIGRGEGRVLLDLDTGEKRLFGDVDDLGGMPVTGRAIVSGAPLEPINVALPFEIEMGGLLGGRARLRDFVTSLPAMPMLDENGRLEFSFSATLVVSGEERAGGDLRARVPISVTYL